MSDRPHDVVLFGATGFTGALTAEYLVANAGEARVALAGRNREKLEKLDTGLPLLRADAEDPGSLREMAESARVVITTVGPYIKYGEPLVAACAEAGTDYVDLTGEPEFVDRMYIRYDARAQETGARIVHSCGFDSIPHDLGVYFTVQQLPEGAPIKVEGFVRAGGTFSGGTFESALLAFSRVRQLAKVSGERKRLEPRPDGRRVRGIRGTPKRQSSLGAWALPMPTIDPQVVLRSARRLDRYGPDFSYGHYVAVKSLPVAAGLPMGMAGLFAVAQVPPARNWLLGLRKPGGDPGYGETAKMLAESALCLAQDELPQTAGQVTTAVAMGDALIERLRGAGIAFEVLDKS